jgi:hypothetical protein
LRALRHRVAPSNGRTLRLCCSVPDRNPRGMRTRPIAAPHPNDWPLRPDYANPLDAMARITALPVRALPVSRRGKAS